MDGTSAIRLSTGKDGEPKLAGCGPSSLSPLFKLVAILVRRNWTIENMKLLAGP